MTGPVALQLLAIVAGMVFSAFFSGIETGIISIHRLRLRHFVKRGTPGADTLEGYLENSDRLLGTTLVGNNICVVAVSVLAAGLAAHALGEWGESASTVVMTLLVLTFAEYLPKAWFHSRPLDRCRRFVGLLRVFELVLKPLSVTIIWITRLVLPGRGKSFEDPAPFVTKEDIKLLAHEGEKSGVLSARERFMIHRVFELSHKRARQIMTPREKMVTVDADTTLATFFDRARETRLTRMPVFDRHERKFVGIVNVFYVLSSVTQEDARPVREFMRPPLFIRENMPVDDILPRMRRYRQPMCLVADAEGEVLGLVTTEDILEEIVGTL